MIYPKKKKVRSFGIGGAMGSLFDNPGTYLGIQYIPKQQDLPDIEGMQYMLAQEEAGRKNLQERADKAKPDLSKLNEAFKKALTGEMAHVSAEIGEKVNSYYQKYDTPEKMVSNEALSEGAMLVRTIQQRGIELQNNEATYWKNRDDNKDVLSNTYYNNGLVYVTNPETGRPKGVSYEDYQNEKDGIYKGTSPLNINDMFNFKMQGAGLGEFDFNVNQYSDKETREYITSHFNRIGSETESFEGGSQLKGMLSQVGIDASNIDLEKFSIKIKSGEVNANKLYNVMIKGMDTKAVNAIAAQMIEQGHNLKEQVTIGKDENGKDIVLDKMSSFIHETLTGEIAKTLNNERDISITPTGTGKDGKGAGAGDGFAANRLTNIMNPNVSLEVKSDQMNIKHTAADRNRMVWSPYSNIPINNIPVLEIFNLTNDEKGSLLGDLPKFEPSDDQSVIFNGQEVRIGNGQGVQFWDTPIVKNLISYDVNNLDGKAENINVLTRYVVTNLAGLKLLKDNNGEPMTQDKAEKDETGLVRQVSKSQLASEMKMYGIDEDIVESNVDYHGWFGNYAYLVKIEQKMDGLSGYGDGKDIITRSDMGDLKGRMENATGQTIQRKTEAANTHNFMSKFLK